MQDSATIVAVWVSPEGHAVEHVGPPAEALGLDPWEACRRLGLEATERPHLGTRVFAGVTYPRCAACAAPLPLT